MIEEEALEALGEPIALLIKSYLARRKKPAELLASGVVATPLGASGFEAPWQMWFATGGTDREWLVVQVRAAHRVPRDRWPSALTACNSWNQSSPFTKAWLAVDSWETAPGGALVLEASLPLGGGGPEQEVVDRFLDTLEREAVEFWRALVSARDSS
jgi:hypothetical protein